MYCKIPREKPSGCALSFVMLGLLRSLKWSAPAPCPLLSCLPASGREVWLGCASMPLRGGRHACLLPPPQAVSHRPEVLPPHRFHLPTWALPHPLGLRSSPGQPLPLPPDRGGMLGGARLAHSARIKHEGTPGRGGAQPGRRPDHRGDGGKSALTVGPSFSERRGGTVSDRISSTGCAGSSEHPAPHPGVEGLRDLRRVDLRGSTDSRRMRAPVAMAGCQAQDSGSACRESGRCPEGQRPRSSYRASRRGTAEAAGSTVFSRIGAGTPVWRTCYEPTRRRGGACRMLSSGKRRHTPRSWGTSPLRGGRPRPATLRRCRGMRIPNPRPRASRKASPRPKLPLHRTGR